MNNAKKFKMIVIGGSAGSLPVFMHILKRLPPAFSLPVIMVVHRQRNIISDLADIFFAANPAKKIIEPDDKEIISPSTIYLAPQNYHLLIENDLSFSLDYSETVQYSRPSIDVTFESAARVYKNELLAILLSGANSDGAAGLQQVVDYGGIGIAQDPLTAEYPAMPVSAIARVKNILVSDPENISNYLNSIICN